MANGTYYHDGEGWKPTYERPPLRRPVVGREPEEGDIPCVYFDTGGQGMPFTKDEGDIRVHMRYVSRTATIEKPVTAKVQGHSSAANPDYKKRNWTIKIYADDTYEDKQKLSFKGWPKMNKFVLKAGWTMPGHLRNVGAAQIWGQIVRSRSDFDSLPEELRSSPNLGATDGFHVRVFIDGQYWGIYDWIVAKDQLFGQDKDNPLHSILNSEYNSRATCAFADANPVIDGNWSEELLDEMTADTKASMESWIKFVMEATDEEFVARAEEYFDAQSAIDSICFDRIIMPVDNLCKNQIVFKYDTKWFIGKWDLDAVLGLPPLAGQAWFPYNTPYQTGYVAYKDNGITNMLYKRTEELFSERFKERYWELRGTVLSENNLVRVFGQLSDRLRSVEGLRAEENAATTGNGQFTAMPNVAEDTIQQIRACIVKRCAYMDTAVSNLGNIQIAESFDASSWTAGYWDPDYSGKLTSYGNMHHSDLIPLASLAEGADVTAISSSTNFPVLRVNYFDSAGVWLGFDMGEVTDLGTGVQKPTPINRPEGAVYFAISANSTDKSAITITEHIEELSVAESFDASSWTAGYWDPDYSGKLTIYGNFHHSELIPLANLMDGGEMPKITVTSSVTSWPSVRVNYFDGNLKWIGCDFVEHNADGTQEPVPINWPEGAVYFAISANTASKGDITVTIN